MIPIVDVDLDAIRHNYEQFAQAVGVPVMPIVKASAYGHGALPVARTVAAAGAPWLGVADAAEGVALRAAGLPQRILAWRHSAVETWESVIAGRLDLGVSSMEHLALIGEAAQDPTRGRRAADVRIHLKLDTGLGRNGARELEWRTLFAQARELERGGKVRVAGLMSHLSGTSAADDRAQLAAFERARALADEIGLEPEVSHLSATAGALAMPEGRYDLVRLGIGLYGLEPNGPDAPCGLELRPALRLRAPIRRVRDRWAVEIGGGDGLPPLRGELPPLVDAQGERWRVTGMSALHLYLEPLGEAPDPAEAAFDAATDEGGRRELIVIAGPADAGPNVDDWAKAAGTINYEITTRLTGRIHREFRPERPSDEDRLDVWPPIDDPGDVRLAPVRQAVVDLELLAQRLQRMVRRAGALGADRANPDYGVDVSSDAYGHGVAEVLPYIRDAGLPIIVRTRLDLQLMRDRGLPNVRLAPNAASTTRAVYGLDPRQSLPPTLTVRSELTSVKRVHAGQTVSYGYEWRAPATTTIGLVPLGYADAIPRSAFGRARVMVAGWSVPIVGRVAMDQVVVDLSDLETWPGMRVELWGSGPGEITLGEWASWTGWSAEALCANLGERVDRVYVGRKHTGLG